MTEPRLSVTWEAYQKNLCNGLGLLQQRGEFVDMTLAADGHHVKVHQMVLSLVSPFIKELITSAQCPHPVIFLNRVSYQTLQLILEYVYTGEVVVTRDKLDDFLEACKALSIKGLESEAVTSSADQAISAATEPSDNFHSVSSPMEQTIHTGIKRKRTKSFTEADSDETFHENTSMAADSQMEDSHFDDGNDGDEVIVPERQTTDSQTLKNLIINNSSKLQYSISCQGSIQLVLNRFVYHMRHTRKTKEQAWRCSQYKQTACSAYVVTKNDKIVERGCAHNHTFHDKQIMKRMRSGNIFAAYNTAETITLMKKRKPNSE